MTKLPEGFDAYVVATGTPTARNLEIPGRELKGIYLALEMLSQQNRILAGSDFKKEELVNAKGKMYWSSAAVIQVQTVSAQPTARVVRASLK